MLQEDQRWPHETRLWDVQMVDHRGQHH